VPTERFVQTLVDFRSQVRNESLKGVQALKMSTSNTDQLLTIKQSLNSILKACDLIRSDTAPKLGFQVSDIKGGPSLWQSCSPVSDTPL
jgi:hypothetical protein